MERSFQGPLEAMIPNPSIQKPTARQTLVDLFEEFANCSADYIIYDDGYRRWTYTCAQVAQAARSFALWLARQQIRKGDKVVIYSENRPEWVVAFWGCVLNGTIVVPIDYRTSSNVLRRICHLVAARLVLIGEQVRPIDLENTTRKLSDLEWTADNVQIELASLAKDDPVEIVFTSGATGDPKGVVITHRNILANLVSPEQVIGRYRKWLRPLFPMRCLVLVPLSHMFGQMLAMFVMPLLPAVALFMNGFSPHEIARQIFRSRVSIVITVPKLMEVMRTQVLSLFPNTVAAPNATRCHWLFRWWSYRGVHLLFGWKFWAFIVGAAQLPRGLEEFWRGLGFGVIQGYGLTETAPIVTFNDPFHSEPGTVGKPISGVDVKIAADGEILVRGDSVTPGYYQATNETMAAFGDGWFHTGDLGTFDSAGNLVLHGRKKEMIVTPEGLKVFAQDVEAVLDTIPGVRESAVVGRDRVHAVLVLENGCNRDDVIRRANLQLEEYQKIRAVSVWPGARLPRTESTQKVKHAEIQAWVDRGSSMLAVPEERGIEALVGRYAPNRTITPTTTLDELGLSSLDRVQLMLDLERQLDTSVNESALSGSSTVAALADLGIAPQHLRFPTWNRGWMARIARDTALSVILLPLTRCFARTDVSGIEHLALIKGPVVFAPNHQSHLDTPVILSVLPKKYRRRLAVAMWKEYFDAHFRPAGHKWYEQLCDTVLYYLVSLFFNAFPIPQLEPGTRDALRYIGDLVSHDSSILFFPEGERTERGEIKTFQPGISLIAARLGVAVIPIRLRGVEKVLHRHARWPHRGRVEITIGRPLLLKGNDYTMLAREVETAVRTL